MLLWFYSDLAPAPEVSAQDTYSLAVDMWSVGCIVFFMLCKASPFSADTAEEVDRLASEATFSFPEGISISAEGKIVLIISNFQPNPLLAIYYN